MWTPLLTPKYVIDMYAPLRYKYPLCIDWYNITYSHSSKYLSATLYKHLQGGCFKAYAALIAVHYSSAQVMALSQAYTSLIPSPTRMGLMKLGIEAL